MARMVFFKLWASNTNVAAAKVPPANLANCNAFKAAAAVPPRLKKVAPRAATTPDSTAVTAPPISIDAAVNPTTPTVPIDPRLLALANTSF